MQDEDDHVLEAMLGFPLFTDGEERLGWLMNLNAVRVHNHAPCRRPTNLRNASAQIPISPTVCNIALCPCNVSCSQ